MGRARLYSDLLWSFARGPFEVSHLLSHCLLPLHPGKKKKKRLLFLATYLGASWGHAGTPCRRIDWIGGNTSWQWWRKSTGSVCMDGWNGTNLPHGSRTVIACSVLNCKWQPKASQQNVFLRYHLGSFNPEIKPRVSWPPTLANPLQKSNAGILCGFAKAVADLCGKLKGSAKFLQDHGKQFRKSTPCVANDTFSLLTWHSDGLRYTTRQ